MRPEHLFAGVQKLLHVRAGLLAFASPANSEAIHSGATARDSHPLPYSPRFYAGHLNAFERTAELMFLMCRAPYHASYIPVKTASGLEKFFSI